MKILILGGTGAMGQELAPLLAKTPDNMLIITSRKKQKASGNIRYIQGNAMNLDFVTDLLRKNSYDIIVDFMLYSVEEFKSRYELLLKSCKQYLFFSSARVYAASDKRINEDSARLLDISKDQEYLSTGEYSLTKAKEEDILKRSSFDNWIIIRPYKTYNTNRLQLGVMEKEDWIFRAIAGKTVLILGDIQNLHTSLTSAKDTARILQRIIGDASLNGQTIQIANPENITWDEIIKIYSDCIETKYGYKMKIYALKDTSDMELLLGNRYRIKYDGLVNRRFDDKKVREIMGEEFTWTSTKKELTHCVKLYMEKIGNQRRIRNYKIEGAYDRVTGEIEPFKNMHGLRNVVDYWMYRLFSVSAIHKVKTLIRKSS